ncbi:MAG: nitrate/nitrite transporter [Candidatus Bathyarchaeia archaeon]
MEPSSPSDKRYYWIVLILCSLGSLFLGAVNSAYPPILLLIKEELKLTYTESGMLTTAYFTGYTIGQIPWGYSADKFGGGKALAISVLGLAASTLLSGMAKSGMEVVAWRFLAGLLGAGIFVPGVRLISEWFIPERRGMAIGLFGTGTSLGGILGASASPLIAVSYDWRWSLWSFAFLGFVEVPMMWFWLKEASRGRGESGEPREGLDGIVRRWSFWVLGFDQFVRLGMTYALVTWLPTFLFEAHGLNLVLAGTSITIVSVVGIVSNPVGGLVSDRVGEIPVMVASFAAIIPCLYALAVTRDVILVWILIILLGWLTNFIRGPMFAILPKLYGIERAGRSTGYQNTFAAAGAVVLPFIVSFLRDYTASFETGWFSLTLFCGMGSLGTLMLQRSKPFQKNQNA